MTNTKCDERNRGEREREREKAENPLTHIIIAILLRFTFPARETTDGKRDRNIISSS